MSAIPVLSNLLFQETFWGTVNYPGRWNEDTKSDNSILPAHYTLLKLKMGPRQPTPSDNSKMKIVCISFDYQRIFNKNGLLFKWEGCCCVPRTAKSGVFRRWKGLRRGLLALLFLFGLKLYTHMTTAKNQEGLHPAFCYSGMDRLREVTP